METPEIVALKDELETAERDAERLVAGLSDELGMWRADERSWSVAQCLEHLACFNGMYVEAMRAAGDRAREKGRVRRGPALPGVVGRWFLGSIEPPVKGRSKIKTPRSLQPSETVSVVGALDGFRRSQEGVREFLMCVSDLDLASIRFVNPFIPGIRFSVATGLHVIAAHERRHLWQAWGVRRAAEGSGGTI